MGGDQCLSLIAGGNETRIGLDFVFLGGIVRIYALPVVVGDGR